MILYKNQPLKTIAQKRGKSLHPLHLRHLRDTIDDEIPSMTYTKTYPQVPWIVGGAVDPEPRFLGLLLALRLPATYL